MCVRVCNTCLCVCVGGCLFSCCYMTHACCCCCPVCVYVATGAPAAVPSSSAQASTAGQRPGAAAAAAAAGGPGPSSVRVKRERLDVCDLSKVCAGCDCVCGGVSLGVRDLSNVCAMLAYGWVGMVREPACRLLCMGAWVSCEHIRRIHAIPLPLHPLLGPSPPPAPPLNPSPPPAPPQSPSPLPASLIVPHSLPTTRTPA